MKKIIILLLTIFLITGCYDYNELEELQIVSTIFVDFKDEEYIVNYEILNTNKEREKPTYFLTGNGKTFENALEDILKKTTYEPYLSHMQAVVLSDELAKSNLKYLYDYFARYPDIKKDFYVVTCSDINSLLNYESDNKMSIGETLKNLIEYNQKKDGRYIALSFREVFNNFLKNNNYFLGSIELKNNNIVLDKDYLIYDNKLNLEIDKNAILLANLLINNKPSFIYSIKSTYEIYESEIKTEVKKDKVVITFNGTARILNINDEDALSVKDIQKLNNNLVNSIKQYFTNCIEYSKNINYDIYNFNYLYYLHYPKNVNDETWKNLNYEVKVNININEKGLLLESIGDGTNEK